MLHYYNIVVVVQLLSHVWLFAIPWIAAHQASLLLTISWSLPKFVSIEAVMSSNHLILCHPFLLPSIFPGSGSSPGSSHQVSKILDNFSFRISPSNEYSWLISFKIDWFDLLGDQGTLESFFPVPQLKSINSLALSSFYGPILTLVHNYKKNYNFD